MAISTAICNSFKQQIFRGIHDFASATGNDFKIALYQASATMDATTVAYATAGEATGAGYTAGGATMIAITPSLVSATGGGTVILDFIDVSFGATADFTARGCLIYNNDTASNAAVAVIDFGGDQSVATGTFTIVWPAAATNSAILRFS